MKPLTASERASFRSMTDAQLHDIINTAKRDHAGELIDREALEAEEVLLDRSNETARNERPKVQSKLPDDRHAHPMSGRYGEY